MTPSSLISKFHFLLPYAEHQAAVCPHGPSLAPPRSPLNPLQSSCCLQLVLSGSLTPSMRPRPVVGSQPSS